MTNMTMILNKWLMYIDNLINERSTMTMVDNSAIHNFLLMEEVKRLGITLEKGKLCMKMVNYEINSIHEVAQDLAVKIESSLEIGNFSVASMNDFKMTFGIKLLYQANVVPILHLKTISIMSEKTPCMILMLTTKRIRA